MRLVQPDKNQPEKPLADDSLASILEALGAGYSADLAAIVDKISNRPPVEVAPEQTSEPVTISREDGIKQFALARINANNISGAIDFVQRQAPRLLGWLKKQLPAHMRHIVKSEPPPKRTTHFAPDRVLIDAEAGRLAMILGEFVVFRAWAYAHAADDGDGRVDRSLIEEVWRIVGVAKNQRHTRRIIRQGEALGYWSVDRRLKRLYLKSFVKVTERLFQQAYASDLDEIIDTDKPGNRRVHVNLAGDLQEAKARLYAAWWIAKDPDREGKQISRQRLCELWQVSIPTLIAWEDHINIEKQANYAQSNETWVDAVPAYSYLTLNQDGTHSTAWRLPNTYTVQDQQIEQHDNTGKSHHVRQAIRAEKQRVSQRGTKGDAASHRLNRMYFSHDERKKHDAFKACGDYLLKMSRRMRGDVFARRYFHVGQRYGVTIFEPYNIQTDAPETHINQRAIQYEDLPEFVEARTDFRRVLVEHHAYFAALG